MEQHLQQFNEHGYTVIEDFFSLEEAQLLKSEAHRLVQEDLDLSAHPMSVFKSDSDDDKRDFGDVARQKYFFDSADGVVSSSKRVLCRRMVSFVYPKKSRSTRSATLCTSRTSLTETFPLHPRCDS